jgi:hypothetical protein
MGYKHIWHPSQAFGLRLVALRALERALVDASIDGVPQVELVDPAVLNQAAQFIEGRRSAYWAKRHLSVIADFLIENRLTKVSFDWRVSNKKPEDFRIVVGQKAAKWRREKLPQMEVVEKLGEAFRLATDQIDIVATSIPALLMCAPSRINEAFRLPADCEVEEEQDTPAYGIRWWPSKGGHPMVKWVIVSGMIEVAKTAIERLRTATSEARRIALWYEEHPGQLYLATGLEHLREQEFLSHREVGAIIGCKRRNVYKWAENNGCKISELGYRFRDIETAVVAMLPKGFPVLDQETSLTYSKSLIVVQKNLFHVGRATYKCMVEAVTIDTINDQLGSGAVNGRARKSNAKGLKKSSIFTRLGMKNADGTDIKILSHQFRRLLNTMAQRKHISQLIIALWSGRKDVQQNAAYDLRSPEEMVQMLRDVTSSDDPGSVVPVNTPATQKEFLALDGPIIHATPWGFCVHDYSLLPCEKHRNCLECREHRCVKGTKEKTARVRFCLQEAERQLARDEQALSEGTIGVDVWLRYNRRRVQQLRELVAIFDDPNIPEGSVIVFAGEEYSPIAKAIEERLALGDGDAEVLSAVRSRSAVQAGPTYRILEGRP